MSIVESTTYNAPGESGSPVELKERYENFIGGSGSPRPQASTGRI